MLGTLRAAGLLLAIAERTGGSQHGRGMELVICITVAFRAQLGVQLVSDGITLEVLATSAIEVIGNGHAGAPRQFGGNAVMRRHLYEGEGCILQPSF